MPRSAWSTEVYISEFMASNSSLANSFGETEDWIEIYNDSSQTIDLDGWHLTDSPAEPAKWSFPSVSLGSKQYLVVWASGRDVEANGELHTNFKLDKSGEYLALVRPDGTTVEHEYSPVYPEQKTDVSYGVTFEGNGSELTLSPSQTDCRYKVPTTDIGSSWKSEGFNDLAWPEGVTAIGFDRGSTPTYDEYNNTDIETEMYGVSGSVYIRIPFVVDDPAAFTSIRFQMRYDDGFAAYLNGTAIGSDNLPSGATPSTLAWNAVALEKRDETESIVFTDIYTSTNPALDLVAGTNVLAIQGLNRAASDGDLLMQTQIIGTLDGEYSLAGNHYFSTPTPGAANSGSAEGFVKDTKFSVDRGIFTEPFAVSISCVTEETEIRYTLDGSTPTDVSGTVYSSPIPISGTTVLRAAAFRTGWEASDVDTQTYIFPTDVQSQSSAPAGWPSSWNTISSDYEMDPDIVQSPDYAADFPDVFTRIPTLSIVTDQSNLFGGTGIYDYPREEGVAWERAASAELIHPDGSKGFQVNCGLRIQGGSSRFPTHSPKHSFRLLFKELYGPTKLEYDLFEDSDVDSFDTIILRAGYNNNWIHWNNLEQRARAQYARDWFARKTQAAMGHAASHGNMVHLYVNGLYWGIYNPSERPTAGFTSEHLGGDKEDWDTLNAGELKDGDLTAWNTMHSIANSGITSLANYESFMEYCDVENLADYMIINHYIGNMDWDTGNWYAGRRRRDGEGYKFFCWDSERGVEDVTTDATTIEKTNRATGLFHKARLNEEFKLLFADRLHKHFFNDGPLTPANAEAAWREIAGVIDGIVVAESARWGDYRDQTYTKNDHYLPEQERILDTHLPFRTAIVLDQYKALDLYPDLDAPEFTQHGGFFTDSTTISLSGPSTIYYTLDGTDPREFGTGAIAGTPYSGAIPLDYSTRVKARCYDGSEWSALTEADFTDLSPAPLRITEIMHSPREPDAAESLVSTDASDYQFIEIRNTGTETIGLLGVELVDGIRFDFSASGNLLLAPGAFAVVAKDRDAFAARYPTQATNLAGEFLDGLSTGGEPLKVLAAGIGTLVSFSYGDGREWPLAADGAGHSLVPTDSAADLDWSYGPNWRASTLVDGSPGEEDPTADTAVCLNEITGHTDFSDPDHPDYDSNDWIELYNRGNATVLLDGYYLSDDPYDLLKWAIPSGLQLAPSAFIAFDEVTGFHSPIDSGFGINKAGEQVLLSYAPGGTLARVVDAHTFKGQENGASIGRYPDGAAYWISTSPTFGAANQQADQGAVIAEIMYHPLGDGGTNENTNLEFIELHNPTQSDIPFWTDAGSWQIDGDVDYTFPDSTILSAGQRVLVVPFDPLDTTLKDAFTAHYNLAEAVDMFGPFDGKLSNQGGRITLEKPQAPDAVDEDLSWIIVDELFFAESSPWASSADGLGYSLHRTSVGSSAANPASWSDGAPSPGTGSVVQPDLRISIRAATANEFMFGFDLLPDTAYVLESTTNLTGDWATSTELQNEYDLTEPISPTNNAVFFRLRRQND
jgi:hypothetical protein